MAPRPFALLDAALPAYRPPPAQETKAARVRRLAAALLDAPHVRLVARGDLCHAALDPAARAEAALAERVAELGRPLVLEAAPGLLPPLAAALAEARWGAYAAVPLRMGDGHVVGVLAVADDRPRDWGPAELARLEDLAALVTPPVGRRVTRASGAWVSDLAQREAQEARRKNEQRLALIFNSTSDLTILLAVESPGDFRCVAVNESFLSLTGLTEGQVVGHAVRDFLPEPAATVALARYAEALESGAPVRYEETVELPIGRLVVDMTLTPILDEAGDCRYLLGVGRDIGARRQMEDELRAATEAAEAARAAAEQASRSKSEFLSRMSHELRTPLNSVIGFATVLRANGEDRLDARELSYLDRIVGNGRHLLTIIGDILDIARIEAGRLPLTISPVPLAPLVRTTLDELEAQVAGRPIELCAELPPVLQRLDTDATRLQQVLINLVGNALKFTERGAVTVRVEADPTSGRPLRIAVSDTGPGIPPERQAAIFEAFEQGESGTTRSHDGTGLGLAISRSLCELMGYALTVASRPGEGATFTIELEDERGV